MHQQTPTQLLLLQLLQPSLHTSQSHLRNLRRKKRIEQMVFISLHFLNHYLVHWITIDLKKPHHWIGSPSGEQESTKRMGITAMGESSWEFRRLAPNFEVRGGTNNQSILTLAPYLAKLKIDIKTKYNAKTALNSFEKRLRNVKRKPSSELTPELKARIKHLKEGEWHWMRVLGW